MSNETTQMIINAASESMYDVTAITLLPMAGFLFLFGTPLVFAAMAASMDN